MLSALSFAGCQNGLVTPSAGELLAYQQTAFLCGFTVSDATLPADTTLTASLARTAEGDNMTVTGKYSRTGYLFSGESCFLCSDLSTGEDALKIPVTMPDTGGVGAWRSLFLCVFPDTAAVSRTAEGLCVESVQADGTYRLIFSEDGTPRSLSRERDGQTLTLTITSFAYTEDPTAVSP